MSIGYTFWADGELAVACWHGVDGAVRLLVADKDGVHPETGMARPRAIRAIVDLNRGAAEFLSRALIQDPTSDAAGAER